MPFLFQVKMETNIETGKKELLRAVTFEMAFGLGRISELNKNLELHRIAMDLPNAKREDGSQIPLGWGGMSNRMVNALKIAAKPELTSNDRQVLDRLQKDFVILVKEAQQNNESIDYKEYGERPDFFQSILKRIGNAKPTEYLSTGIYLDHVLQPTQEQKDAFNYFLMTEGLDRSGLLDTIKNAIKNKKTGKIMEGKSIELKIDILDIPKKKEK